MNQAGLLKFINNVFPLLNFSNQANICLCPQYYSVPRVRRLYYLDRVQELWHQNDRVVLILVANMLICL